jgi:hypothetical protein
VGIGWIVSGAGILRSTIGQLFFRRCTGIHNRLNRILFEVGVFRDLPFIQSFDEEGTAFQRSGDSQRSPEFTVDLLTFKDNLSAGLNLCDDE